MKIFVRGRRNGSDRSSADRGIARQRARSRCSRPVSPEKAQALVQQGIEPAIADVFDPDAVKAVVSPALSRKS